MKTNQSQGNASAWRHCKLWFVLGLSTISFISIFLGNGSYKANNGVYIQATARRELRTSGATGIKALLARQEEDSNGSTESASAERDAFVQALVEAMTPQELVMQLHMTFGDSAVGPNSSNELYPVAARYAPLGVVHDWYPLSPPSPNLLDNHYNSLQALNLENSRLPVPFMQLGECLHGVGSYKQSMFPSPIGLAASWDEDLVKRVGRAIGAEVRSVGIHACFAPVLDLGKEVRWGRVQEAWGEDYVLTTHMGVAFSLGLSKDAQWHEPDAVVPVVKHFTGHGSPSGGINAAPYSGAGPREYLMEFFRPFKAVLTRGGGKGVMMAYHEFDSVPAHVNPFFYDALDEWGFDGFVIADDTGMLMLRNSHMVTSSVADTIDQWFQAGGMIQFYDFDLDTYMNTTLALLSNSTLSLSTLRARASGVLRTKWDLGLFRSSSGNPTINSPERNSTELSFPTPNSTSLYIPTNITYEALTSNNAPLTLEAAQKSIVLLENRNNTLPLKPAEQGLERIALIGPFGDILNYGDYSGPWGAYPVPTPENAAGRAGTLREGVLGYLEDEDVELVTSVGANTWLYNAQYGIPSYLLTPASSNTSNTTLPTSHGLLATYFAETDFSDPCFQRVEAPNRDWGLYPAYDTSDDGEVIILPSNNFSVVWEGELEVPLFAPSDPVEQDASLNEVNGFIGVAVSSNASARLFLDDNLVATSSYPAFNSSTFRTGTFLGNIEPLSFSIANSTIPPIGAGNFTFKGGRKYKVRLEFQTWNLAVKIENVNSLNSQLALWWNLVEQTTPSDSGGLSAPVQKAVDIAKSSDLIILAVGANWNSDGEGGDRATLGLSVNQTELADALFTLGIPVVLVLQGGRPFAIPEYYEKAAAVLDAFFPGQSGGQAIADILFGSFNPGGRITLSVPYSEAALPVYYNYHSTRHAGSYTDIPSFPYYYFGYGLSYTTFSTSNFNASSTGGTRTFSTGEIITFRVTVKNEGEMAGSYVAQVYLLNRVSAIVRPLHQLVAFKRVYLGPGESQDVSMTLDVDEFLPIVNRRYEWELELGDYTFALLENGGPQSAPVNVTLTCVGA